MTTSVNAKMILLVALMFFVAGDVGFSLWKSYQDQKKIMFLSDQVHTHQICLKPLNGSACALYHFKRQRYQSSGSMTEIVLTVGKSLDEEVKNNPNQKDAILLEYFEAMADFQANWIQTHGKGFTFSLAEWIERESVVMTARQFLSDFGTVVRSERDDRSISSEKPENVLKFIHAYENLEKLL